jgi:F-type H+-transporting ATPase subunit delta
MAKLISRRYANALFELALESNKLDLYKNEIELIYDSVTKDNEFLKILNHPQITSEEKAKMLDDIFKAKVSDDIIALFHLMLRKNREAELIDVLSVFLEKYNAYKGITTALVYSAKPLSEAQLNTIKQKLSQNLNKQVDIKAEVDPALIGGVKILVDGHIIDGTIKKKLDDLKKQLLNIHTA